MKPKRRTLMLILVLCSLDPMSGESAGRHSVMTHARQDPAIVVPRARHARREPAVSDSKSVVVSVASESEIYIGRARVARQDLATAIKGAMSGTPRQAQIVFIRSSAAIQFRTVRDVLNAIRAAGCDDLRLVVESAAPSHETAVLEAMLFTPSAAVPFGSDSVVVEVNSTGQKLTVNTQPVDLSGLRSFLKTPLEMRPDKTVFIKPAADRSYADVIAAADEIVGAGARPLAVLLDDVAVPRGMPGPVTNPPIIRTEGSDTGVPGGVPAEPAIKRPILVRKSEGLLRSTARHRVEPETPPHAKKEKVSGKVIVEITVGEDGDVLNVRVLSGPPLLRDAAASAARQWKFNRTILSGNSVKVIGTLSFVFK